MDHTQRFGNRYILVMVDQFSKYCELVPTKDQNDSTVVNEFYKNIVCRHGVPERLLTDNGKSFRML